jgi:ribosomal protein S6
MQKASQVEGNPETLSHARILSDEKAIYEVGFHVAPSLSEEEVGAVVQKIKAALATGGAEIVSEGAAHKMALAYTIEIANSGLAAQAGKRAKYNEAYFGWIKFESDRQAIPALEQMLRGAKETIRYLLIITVREDAVSAPRRAVFTSDRLEGETIQKPVAAVEVPAEISESELDKSIDALIA